VPEGGSTPELRYACCEGEPPQQARRTAAPKSMVPSSWQENDPPVLRELEGVFFWSAASSQ